MFAGKPVQVTVRSGTPLETQTIAAPEGAGTSDQEMSEYGQESMWRDTAAADAELARDLAARLERRAKAEDEVAARDTYLGLLDIAAGERVLDVGSDVRGQERS